MKKEFISLLCFITLFGVSSVNAQTYDNLCNVINQNDIKSLVEYAARYPDSEKQVVDVLCSLHDISELTYEQLSELSKLHNRDTSLGHLLHRENDRKELEIFSFIEPLTLEEINSYIEKYPERKSLVQRYIDKSIGNSLPNLSYLELNYVSTTMKGYEKSRIKAEIGTRSAEKKELMAQNVNDFLVQEQKSLPRLEYVMEKIIWSFFVEGHKQLVENYSRIPMVPDDAYSAAHQYQELVNVCLSPKTLQKMLQTEVDNYCEQVNKARKDYALIAGVKEYPKMSYKVPLIALRSNVDYGVLYNIAEARRDFVVSRRDVSQGSGVLGWLTGGLWGLGAKFLGDWYCISDLVDTEYNARKVYVQDVYENLYASFEDYSKKSLSQIKTTLTQNEKSYEKFIKQ